MRRAVCRLCLQMVGVKRNGTFVDHTVMTSTGASVRGNAREVPCEGSGEPSGYRDKTAKRT